MVWQQRFTPNSEMTRHIKLFPVTVLSLPRMLLYVYSNVLSH